MTPADLKAALVEEINRAVIDWYRSYPKATTVGDDVLSAIPAVLERAGCKVLGREPTPAMIDAAQEKSAEFRQAAIRPLVGAEYSAVFDAAPRVPWEEK